MSALLLPQVLLRQAQPPQADLDLAAEGVLRYVWASNWGDMLIEVRDGVAYVNGQRVDAAPASATSVSVGGGRQESSNSIATKNR